MLRAKAEKQLMLNLQSLAVWPNGLETTIYQSRCEYANYYTTDVICAIEYE
jgi:hypothetical protein